MQPFLNPLDAETIRLDFDVWVAEQARSHRISQAAIVAAIKQQPATSSQPQAAAASTDQVDASAGGFVPQSSADQSHQAETLGEEATAPRDKAVPGQSGGGHEPSPAPTRGRKETTRAKVIACHHENPSWPSKLIAEHLGISEDAVRATASRKGLKLVSWWDHQRALASQTAQALRQAVQAAPAPIVSQEPEPAQSAPPEPAKRITMADQIREHLVDHPDASAGEVATAIGKKITSVSWAALRAGITLRKLTAEEHAEASRRGAEGRAKPYTDLPPAKSLPTPRTEIDTDQPASKYPRRPDPARFYVRDSKGRYLHNSLEPSPTDDGPLMTTNRAWAWFDNSQRYRGALKRWPEIANLRKEGPRA